MISASQLPDLNAALNSLSAVFLLTGYGFIKSKNQQAHRRCMLAAFACSILFLISYLIYHYQVGSVPFKGQGPIRTVYFTILITHTVLATTVVRLGADSNTTMPPEFLKAVQEYNTKPGYKAIALALDSDGKWAYGSISGWAAQPGANDEALAECARFALKSGARSACKLFAVGDKVVW